MKLAVLVAVILLVFSICAIAEPNLWMSSDLSLHARPQFVLQPSTNATTYAPAADVTLQYNLPFFRLISLKANVGYTPLEREGTVLNLIDVGAAFGLFFPLGMIGLDVSVGTGFGFGIIEDSSSGVISNTSNPYLSAGVSASYRFSESFSAGLGVRYKTYILGFHKKLRSWRSTLQRSALL